MNIATKSIDLRSALPAAGERVYGLDFSLRLLTEQLNARDPKGRRMYDVTEADLRRARRKVDQARAAFLVALDKLREAEDAFK